MVVAEAGVAAMGVEVAEQAREQALDCVGCGSGSGAGGGGAGCSGSGGNGIAPRITIGTRSAINRLRPTISLLPRKDDTAQAFSAIATSMRVSMLGVFWSIVSGEILIFAGLMPTRFK